MIQLSAFRRLVFWSNAHSMLYQSMLQCFVNDGIEVVWVAQRGLEKFIVDQGQPVAELPGGEMITMADPAAVDRAIETAPSETVHIFVGFSGHDTPAEAVLPRIEGKGLFVGFFHENRPRDGLKNYFRRLLFARHALKNRRTMRFLMVQGYGSPLGGRAYFRSVGFPDEKLFPFGYFGSRPERPSTPLPGSFRILFAGQHIVRKGGDFLIKALAGVPGDWTLELVGDGAKRKDWETLVEASKLGDKVRFLGNTPHHRVLEKFGEVDLFVLPSRFDGWGMVTNEALYQGVPVVVSDRCGSIDLLVNEELGTCVPTGDIPRLREAIERRMVTGKRTETQSRRIWAASECFTGRAAATYLRSVIEHVAFGSPRPVAPWLAPP